MSERNKILTRTILLRAEAQRDLAISILRNAPLDADKPIQFVLREEPKIRKLDQSAAMWAGPLRDIAEQARADKKQYAAESWHEHFKREYLPEDDDPDLPQLARDGYHKWGYTPFGERVLVGSTTHLLVRGMALYMEQVVAAGASMGVKFNFRG